MRRTVLLAALAALVSVSSVSAQPVVYDAITGSPLTFTGSTPRTYMGQGFDVADLGVGPTGTEYVTKMNVVLVTGAAVNYQNTRIRVQFWDNYNAANNPVFGTANGGTQVFTTGPFSTTGVAAFNFTLTFAAPIPMNGLTNHGIGINWQSDAAGTGTFIDDTNLTTALRATTTVPLTSGQNDNPSSAGAGPGYYRNASGETDLNFQSSDARTIAGVSGLVFSMQATVPEPGSLALCGLGLAGLPAWIRRRRAPK
jgi:hypothetical protein